MFGVPRSEFRDFVRANEKQHEAVGAKIDKLADKIEGGDRELHGRINRLARGLYIGIIGVLLSASAWLVNVVFAKIL